MTTPPLPDHVSIREVGPRDGFQNEPELISTNDKVRLIDQLARPGIGRLGVTSFVCPDVTAQFADGSEVLRRIDPPESVSISVHIRNERGLAQALADRAEMDEISVCLGASETHNRKNVNRSIDDSLRASACVLTRARRELLRCEAVIATSFGCPYEGAVATERVLGMARTLIDAGAEEVAFGDTTGMANPVQVADFFATAGDALPDAELTAQFHNTRGQGLANVHAALQAGDLGP